MTETPEEQFERRGWVAFPPDPEVQAWALATWQVARALADAEEARTAWLRCGGTWFAGVNILPNGPDGSIPSAGVAPLGGPAMRFVADRLGLGGIALDRAQVSICYPGYPKPWDGESDAAHRYRLRRDAAHVDGLLRDEARRRRPGEQHAFILGLPLTEAAPDAAPFVVWEGSHEVVREALRARLAGVAPDRWSQEDVTDAYVAARRQAFELCRRVQVHAQPGGAYLCHRLLLHGVAPWAAARDGSERAIAYFRPELTAQGRGELAPDWWLSRA